MTLVASAGSWGLPNCDKRGLESFTNKLLSTVISYLYYADIGLPDPE
jgi:hypothetical protein